MGGSSSKPTEETPLKRDSELLRHDEEAPESKNAVSALFEDVRERVNRDEVYKKHWKMAMQEAEVVSYLQRCVKREQVADRKQGQYYSTEHGAIKVERFAIRGKPDDLRHYGCSVAVELFLSFQLWGAALLGLMFLITLPPMIDSMSRNSLRQDCRNGLLNGGYVALLAGEGTLGSECGYAGLNVMNYPPPSLVGSTSFPLSGALGACQEYSNATFPVEPQPLGIHTNHDTYVETDAAEFCIGNHGRGRASMALSSLCGTINVLLIMLFILWMRRKANYHVAEVDKAMLTAADYAVYIAGLEKGVDPEVATEGQASLRSRLLADLQRLGLPADAVDHIAFGLVCREDLHLMREEAALVIAKKEFDQRSSLRVERGEAPHTAYSHKQEAKLLAKLEILRRTLRERAKATPRSTGHAFVCFRLEQHRNTLLKYIDGVQKGKASVPAELESLAPPGTNREPFDIQPAPEPSEIRWENLELDDVYERKAKVLTGMAALTLVLALMVVTVIMKVNAVLAVTVEGVSVEIGYYIAVGIGNPILKSLITYMATREGLDTTTEEERSLFSKLSVSLHFNTLIIPILLAFWQSFTNTGSFRISQAWYETGGIIDGFAILAISNVAIDGLLQMFPLDMYINRWVLAPFTISQYKLNRLMLPPEMPIAYLHAISFKTISLCLLYSAIYPPAYLLTAALLLFVYFFTIYGVAFHYRRPKKIDEDMMAQLRLAMALCVLEHIIVMLLGQLAAAPPSQRGAAIAGPVVAFCVWAFFFFENFVPRPEAFLRWMREHEGAAYEQDDTGGTQYAEIAQINHYEAERYVCPAITTLNVDDIDQLCLDVAEHEVVTTWEKLPEAEESHEADPTARPA